MWSVFLFVIIMFLGFLYLLYLAQTSSSSTTTTSIYKKPLKLQSKVDEWNKMYGSIDVSSFDLGMESRNKKILFDF
jgi:hypothetical protein